MRLWSFGLAALSSSLAFAAPLPAQPDNGFVTPVHKEKSGTIVFAKSAAAVTTPEKPAEFVTSFKSSDSIWLRAYLPMSLNNAFREQGVECADPFRVWTLEVDGKEVGAEDKAGGFFWEPMQGDAFKKSTSVRFDQPLNGKPSQTESSIWRAFAEKVAPQLKAGEHQIKLSVRGSCDALNDHRNRAALEKDLASGTLTLVVDKSAVVDVLPKPARQDPALVKDATTILAAEWRPDRILKVIPVDKNWNVETVMLKGKAIPQRRTINTVVAVQQEKGCRVFNVSFEQPAKSMTTFGATQRAGTGDSRPVDCGALK